MKIIEGKNNPFSVSFMEEISMGLDIGWFESKALNLLGPRIITSEVDRPHCSQMVLSLMSQGTNLLLQQAKKCRYMSSPLLNM
jgi:hypothetical protein